MKKKLWKATTVHKGFWVKEELIEAANTCEAVEAAEKDWADGFGNWELDDGEILYVDVEEYGEIEVDEDEE